MKTTITRLKLNGHGNGEYPDAVPTEGKLRSVDAHPKIPGKRFQLINAKEEIEAELVGADVELWTPGEVSLRGFVHDSMNWESEEYAHFHMELWDVRSQ